MMRIVLTLAALLYMLSMASCFEGEVSAQDRAVVQKVLREKRIDWSKTPAEEFAEKLKFLGASAIRTLETFLTDRDLGGEAAETMLVLDKGVAAPLIFASMPRSDRNIQFHTFKLFIRLIQEGEKITCRKEMHDAAIRCLEADTNADAGEQALYAIGLTGDISDFPLLQKLYDNTLRTPVWRAKLRNAAEAALARLGNQTYISNIKNRLSKAISDPFTRDDAVSLVECVQEAAFTGNREFVPLLRVHLNTPEPQPRTDDIVSPAYSAGLALEAILGKNWRIEDSKKEQSPAGNAKKNGPD
ncbi:MAG: hypothetical protein HQM09_09885 [Candidatus Riflebacteria bacterium]|nr:hypothetical protein [Candidatus Riflebacteria bacterium]